MWAGKASLGEQGWQGRGAFCDEKKAEGAGFGHNAAVLLGVKMLGGRFQNGTVRSGSLTRHSNGGC